MHKGEPVLVRGRFKTNTYEDKDGRPRTETRITADTVGHDLSRGVANYIRQRSKQQAADAGAAGDQAPGSPDQAEGPDEMIDEDAIERFGRDLDDADLAARALTEDRNAEDDEDAEDDERSRPTPPRPRSPRRPINYGAPATILLLEDSAAVSTPPVSPVPREPVIRAAKHGAEPQPQITPRIESTLPWVCRAGASGLSGAARSGCVRHHSVAIRAAPRHAPPLPTCLSVVMTYLSVATRWFHP